MSEQGSGPALGVLELSSIARGVIVTDAVVKRAPVALLSSRPVSSGRHLVYLRGGVAEVEEAMDAGRLRAEDALVDSLFLPMAHEQLWPRLPEPGEATSWADDADAAAAIVETSTVCAALGAVDAACKVADVVLRDLRLAMGIAGKGVFTLTGTLDDIEAAVDVARSAADTRLVATEVIPAPAAEILGRLLF